MPLIKSKSKKALDHNIEAEMSSGKPQDQALAISYDVQRKAKRRKMAQGGPVSAATEMRPMPDSKANDASMVHRNDEKKSMPYSSFSAPHRAEQAASRPKMVKIKHPSFVQSPTFKARFRDQEDDLEASMPPASPMEEPSEAYNEEEADKHGDEVASLHMKMMAEGGSVEHEEDVQPEPEAEMEHHDSVAAAIMARRKMMAEGGQVDIEENAEEQPNSYYHQNEDAALKENYDSDFQDDKQPMDSNEHGDEIDSDVHDMVSMIRRKIKMRMK